MFKTTHLLLAAAIALAAVQNGLAQETPPKPLGAAVPSIASLFDQEPAGDPLPPALPPSTAPATPSIGDRAAILQSLPRPPDLPSSLFAPPQPRRFGFLRLDAPYFEVDPVLDDPRFAPPGWFGGAELQIVKPHVVNGLSGAVQNRMQRANGTSTTVALPSAPLGWAVSPRLFLGYRLPSGFGEFAIAYRHLGTGGSTGFQGPNGGANLSSRLAFDITDLDYSSRQLSCWPHGDMKWTIGVRFLDLFYDTHANQPFAQAAAGNGILQERRFNNLFGVGPHVAVDLAQKLGDSGWALTFRPDFSSTYDWIHDGFSARSTTLGSNGQPLFGETRFRGAQQSPMLNIQAGLRWQPSPNSPTRFFVGYQYERFFALERIPPFGNNPPSTGQLWDQGFVIQATIRF